MKKFVVMLLLIWSATAMATNSFYCNDLHNNYQFIIYDNAITIIDGEAHDTTLPVTLSSEMHNDKLSLVIESPNDDLYVYLNISEDNFNTAVDDIPQPVAKIHHLEDEGVFPPNEDRQHPSLDAVTGEIIYGDRIFKISCSFYK